MPKLRRRFLKGKEVKSVLSELANEVWMPSQQLSRSKPLIELARANDEELYYVDRKPTFARSKGRLFPVLGGERELLLSRPKAIVDMGAIRHVCSGADIMRPGIVSVEGEFEEGDIVVILDEKHRKPLAVAVALHSAETLGRLRKGKVLQNIHYVGDELWGMIRQTDESG